MKSKHHQEFNHDDEAATYDRINLNDPIRHGYYEVLEWTIEQAKIGRNDVVLDLGTGTGNLSKLIQSCKQLVCVDVSSKMMEIAKTKLNHLPYEFVFEDVLAYFDDSGPKFDAIISTYTLHHLVEDEKQVFFQKVFDQLNPGGRAVFGDLMLESKTVEPDFIQKYRDQGMEGVAQAFEEEFFWYIDSAVAGLERVGFHVEAKRFSDLSWVVAAKKPS